MVSGGSYDYLYCWDAVGDLSGRRYQLTRMAERLEGLPCGGEAAVQTRRVLRLLDVAEAVALSLSDVWHDVEWRDSGDYGEKQMIAACEAYRAPAIDAPEGDLHAPDPNVLYRMVDVGGGVYELRVVGK
jgi:hypothetical protein